MTNPYQGTVTGNGVTADFTVGFTMDADLTALDLTVSLNNVLVTNWSKISTTQIRFVALLPTGALVFERNTDIGRKYSFVPGTRILAQQVSDEFNRQVNQSLEDTQWSWRSYYTGRGNAGKLVGIDEIGRASCRERV